MAEYCLDCFNQINKANYKEKDLWVDYEELEICERCGAYKPCVMALYKKAVIERWKDKLKGK